MKIKLAFPADYQQLVERFDSDRPWRNRMIIQIVSGVLLLDYLFFCALAGKGVFAIFPAFPVLDRRTEISVYVPLINSEVLSEEKVLVDQYDKPEYLVRFLFHRVIRGSKYENSSALIPVSLLLKNIWISGSTGDLVCILDVEASHLDVSAVVVPGSEKIVTEGLKKTITSAVPGIKKVIILNHGVSGVPLWEFNRQS